MSAAVGSPHEDHESQPGDNRKTFFEPPASLKVQADARRDWHPRKHIFPSREGSGAAEYRNRFFLLYIHGTNRPFCRDHPDWRMD